MVPFSSSVNVPDEYSLRSGRRSPTQWAAKNRLPSQSRTSLRNLFTSIQVPRGSFSSSGTDDDDENQNVQKPTRRLFQKLRPMPRCPNNTLKERDPNTQPLSRKHRSLMGVEETQQPFLHENESQNLATKRHQTWYFSSNHVLVNRERVKNGLIPLVRNIQLDDKARDIAEQVSNGMNIPSRNDQPFDAVNVVVGPSIRQIHHQMIVSKECRRERRICLSPEFREFGMGTFKHPETNKLYLCQLFATGRLTI